MGMTTKAVSACVGAGGELYTIFSFSRTTEGERKQYYRYDYIHIDGESFSCIKPTLEACRAARDEWLKGRHQA